MMSDARGAILAGVGYISRPGIPGTILVHGTNAVAVMTNKRAEVIIGSGQIDSGRVVVFSHDGYTHQFLKPPTSDQQLVKNVKNWVTNGSYTDDSEIQDVDNYYDFNDIPQTCKILVWIGMQEKSEEFYEKMKIWMRNGGGMVCGATPWGYLQIYPGSTLEDLPLTNILNIVGIKYTDHYLSGEGDMYVSDNLADNSHVIDAIKASNDSFSNLEKYGRNIDVIITYLLDKELEKILPHLFQLFEKYGKTHHCIPTKSKPVETEAGRILASMINRIMIRKSSFNGEKVAQGIGEFPGDFSTTPHLITDTISLSAKGCRSRLFPTGYYLPAGQDVIVSWSSAPSNNWRIVVGAHCDLLYDVDLPWKRWPKIQIERKLESSPLQFSSPFGGAIYLRSPDKKHETFTVTLENVVPTPNFKPGNGPEWNTLRNRAGLWADISGEKMTITLPSSSVRNLPDPTASMALWDAIVNAHYDLRGMDPSLSRGQTAVTDVQPSCGYMHAGYPVVTMMDVADPDKASTN